MATLTQPDDTGTLDREAVQAAARDAAATRTGVTADELDRQAASLRAWLDTHGTAGAIGTAGVDGSDVEAGTSGDVIDLRGDDVRSPAPDRPGILAHQHVWLPTPARHEPTPRRDLEALVDDVFAPITEHAAAEGLPQPVTFVARTQSEVEVTRNRSLGWSLVIGIWAAAAALLVPLMLGAIVGSFDLTVDLGDTTDETVADDAGDAGEDAPADVPVADDAGEDAELADA